MEEMSKKVDERDTEQTIFSNNIAMSLNLDVQTRELAWKIYTKIQENIFKNVSISYLSKPKIPN